MSTVGTITKLASEVVGKAAHAVTHPRQTVAAVTGHARDLAATVTREGQEPSAPAQTPKKTSGTKAGTSRKTPPGPSVVPSPPQNVEPAEPITPAESVEPSTTEPKAASRDAAHHGRGAEPTDDWHDEIEDGPDVGLNPATGLPHRRPGGE